MLIHKGGNVSMKYRESEIAPKWYYPDARTLPVVGPVIGLVYIVVLPFTAIFGITFLAVYRAMKGRRYGY